MKNTKLEPWACLAFWLPCFLLAMSQMNLPSCDDILKVDELRQALTKAAKQAAASAAEQPPLADQPPLVDYSDCEDVAVKKEPGVVAVKPGVVIEKLGEKLAVKHKQPMMQGKECPPQ